MINKLADLQELIKSKTKKTLVLAPAQDPHALGAAIDAQKGDIIDCILVGDKSRIEKIAGEINTSLDGIRIENEPDAITAVERAVKFVHNGEADILMKGKTGTSALLKAILNKEWGLRTGNLLSHFALFDIPAYHKPLALTDVAMNIAPDRQEKTDILSNAIAFMHNIGYEMPKVGILAAVEMVNEAMPATIDAAVLSQMSRRGQFKNCLIDGPLAFDNAISKESAKYKGIISEVAGDADLLLVPNIESGNILYKAFSFFAGAEVASVILGAKAPIVLTSRSDSEASKQNSIMLAAASE